MSVAKIIMRGLSLAMLAGGGAVVAVQGGLMAGGGNTRGGAPDTSTATLFSASTSETAGAEAQVSRAASVGPALFTTAPVAPALPVTSSASLVSLPDAEPAAAPVTTAPDLPAALADAVIRAVVRDTDPEVSDFGLPCDVTVSASALPGALIAVDVMAPCQPEARVLIEHSGLTLTGRTDAMGLMVMDLPAFQSPAYLTVRLPEGDSRNALVHIPDLDAFDRVAVQWEEDRQLMLHAIPEGTAFGAPGHIWQEAPGSLNDAVTGRSGVLMNLGSAEVDTPMLAQVITYPRRALTEAAPVALSVDAPITDTTCGKPVEARAIELARSGEVEVVPLNLTLPGCDAVGDYLVLQNLFADLTVAQN